VLFIFLSGDDTADSSTPQQPVQPIILPPLPVITSFQVSYNALAGGSDIILTPIFSGGTTATISWTDSQGGGGPIAATTGQPIAQSISRNTTYSLTVTNAAGSTFETVDVYIIPRIISFTASPVGPITRGNSVTITPIFEGHNATITAVDGAVGNQVVRQGVESGVAETFTPTITSYYTLRVTNIWGNMPTTSQGLAIQAGY
jgi:hypothetical protein